MWIWLIFLYVYHTSFSRLSLKTLDFSSSSGAFGAKVWTAHFARKVRQSEAQRNFFRPADPWGNDPNLVLQQATKLSDGWFFLGISEMLNQNSFLYSIKKPRWVHLRCFSFILSSEISTVYCTRLESSPSHINTASWPLGEVETLLEKWKKLLTSADLTQNYRTINTSYLVFHHALRRIFMDFCEPKHSLRVSIQDIPSQYLPVGTFESMIFLFPTWDMTCRWMSYSKHLQESRHILSLFFFQILFALSLKKMGGKDEQENPR